MNVSLQVKSIVPPPHSIWWTMFLGIHYSGGSPAGHLFYAQCDVPVKELNQLHETL